MRAMRPALQLDEIERGETFPFHVRITAEGQLLGAGSSLRKVRPESARARRQRRG